METFRIGTLSLSPPLGAAYVAGAVEAAGIRVQVIDALGEAPTKKTGYFRGHLIGLRFDEIVVRISPEATVVGITCIFTHEWPMVARLTEQIHRARPDVTIVVGGEHVTSMPEFSLLTSQADALVLGEGEETVVELLRALASGRPLDEIDGIAFRRGDRVVMNPRRARQTQLEKLPRPAWHHFDLRAYHAHRFVGGVYSERLTVPILATRGCPYQCTFCSSPNMWTTRWVARDPKDVVDEIEGYVKEYGAGNFPFQDLTAVIKKDWIIEFCQEIIDRGLDITWQLANGTRSEQIDLEAALLLKRSGMISAAYAPESGSASTRAMIKKKVKAERMMESIRAAAEAELNICAYMIVGFPHDTPDHMRECLPFLRDIAKAGVRDMGVAYYMALPGTELFRSLVDAGKIRIDSRYFRQVLEGVSPFPAATFCDQLSKADLFYWKVRFYLAFYGTRLEMVGIPSTVRAALQIFRGGSQDTKLQSAVRMAAQNGVATMLSWLGPRWIPRDEEAEMFEGWDRLFRRIWQNRRAAGVEPPAPTDTTQLEGRQFMRVVKLDHELRRSLPVFSDVAAAGPGLGA